MILIKLLTSYSHVLGNISQKSLVFHRKTWYQYFTEKANMVLVLSTLQRKHKLYYFIEKVWGFLQREPEVFYRKHLVFLH